MVVAMEPVKDHYLTNDPCSWKDWLQCVNGTLDGVPLARFPRFLTVPLMPHPAKVGRAANGTVGAKYGQLGRFTLGRAPCELED